MTGLIVEVDVFTTQGVLFEADSNRLSRLSSFVLKEEQARGPWSLSIVLTSDAHLRSLHREFLGIDAETDVMTFPADAPAGADNGGGDIVISVERAAEQATELGCSPVQEVEFLVAHGLLHLCGWKDSTDELRESMHARQQELIDRFQ